jgi:alpha/beta superfamily hydrolase
MKKDISDKELSVVLDIIDEGAPFIIFIPGMSGGGLSEKFDSLGKVVNASGYNLLRFNYNWESKGSIDEATLAKELNDINYALGLLRARGYNWHNYGIISKSFGSIKALLMVDNGKRFLIHLAPVVYLGKPTWERLKNTKYRDIMSVKEIMIDPDTLKKEQGQNLILVGENDKRIDRDELGRLIEVLGNGCKFRVIPDIDHNFELNPEAVNIITDYIRGFSE